MYVSDDTLTELLLKSGKVSEEQIQALRSKIGADQVPLQDLVIKEKLVSDVDILKLYAAKLDVPFIEIDAKNVSKEILGLIPERIARQYTVALFQKDPNGLMHLAMEDPDDVQAIDFIEKQLGKNIKLYVASKQNILAVLDLYRGSMTTEIKDVISTEVKARTEQLITEKEIAEDSPVAQTVNLLIEYAIKQKSSDIHVEPRETYISVRYRIDGVLREVNQLPLNVMNALISRVKILSGLKIDEKRVPQDGRFKITINDKRFALRVSTLPVVDGEKVVMRILDESSTALTLSGLGIWGPALEIINNSIVQPHGMILVTGPTGSGKSTTLFSILSILNNVRVNISTVEDPVEYRIPGVNQTQVNPAAGMTFANGLRALLRQDPNIIMVGEIRDKETAGLAVQAALTGHLVFSTLHTNNAATSLPRLLDMGIEPFLIASTVRCVIGQRLVRRLCHECKEAYTPDIPTLDKVANIFGINNMVELAKLYSFEMKALSEGIGRDPATKIKEVNQPSTTDKAIIRMYRASKDGCAACGHSGYQGRQGIYEVLNNTSAIQQLIVSHDTSEKIQQQAIKEGLMIMQYDGLIKVLRGITSIEEILRVTVDN